MVQHFGAQGSLLVCVTPLPPLMCLGSRPSYTVCILIFSGFIFHRFSIFEDFAFLNPQMLAIVPCVSIDVYIFTADTFVGGC